MTVTSMSGKRCGENELNAAKWLVNSVVKKANFAISLNLATAKVLKIIKV